jgi:hypothetical protein
MENKWNRVRDYITKKGIHFFRLCMLKGNIAGKLGFFCGWENHESLLDIFCVF